MGLQRILINSTVAHDIVLVHVTVTCSGITVGQNTLKKNAYANSLPDIRFTL